MKIGIVSLYGWLKLWDNYGTLLQNFALQTYLRRMGHETYWIRTRAGSMGHGATVPVLSLPLGQLRSFIRWCLSPLMGIPPSAKLASFNRANPRDFGGFLQRYVPCTLEDYSEEELQSRPPAADAYIVGSDQVWRDVTAVNFLDFGGRDVRRVAYAVSAPWPALGESWFNRARGAVSRFNAVSVREVEGLEVCRQIGLPDAVHVIDPTLLLDASDYEAILDLHLAEPKTSGVFALAYFVNVRSLEQIPWTSTVGLANRRALDLHVVPLQGAELVIPPRYLFVPNPVEWIRAFREAKCIITNSYHGALFAVIMRRPFLVCLQGGTTAAENCRFTSILQPLGLHDRILPAAEWAGMGTEALDDRMAMPIDWERVRQGLGRLRAESERFLEAALQATE